MISVLGIIVFFTIFGNIVAYNFKSIKINNTQYELESFNQNNTPTLKN